MIDYDALLTLDIPDLVIALATSIPGGRVHQEVTQEGFHRVELLGPAGPPIASGEGLDPRLALLEALQHSLPPGAPAPNWNPASRADPRRYLNSVAIRANVPDPEDLDPEVLKKAFSR